MTHAGSGLDWRRPQIILEHARLKDWHSLSQVDSEDTGICPGPPETSTQYGCASRPPSSLLGTIADGRRQQYRATGACGSSAHVDRHDAFRAPMTRAGEGLEDDDLLMAGRSQFPPRGGASYSVDRLAAAASSVRARCAPNPLATGRCS